MDLRKLKVDHSSGKHVSKDADYVSLCAYWKNKNQPVGSVKHIEKSINTISGFRFVRAFPLQVQQYEYTYADKCRVYCDNLLHLYWDKLDIACKDAHKRINSMLDCLNIKYRYLNGGCILNNTLCIRLNFSHTTENMYSICTPNIYLEFCNNEKMFDEHNHHFLSYMKKKMKIGELSKAELYGLTIPLNDHKYFTTVFGLIKQYLDNYTEHEFVDYLLNEARSHCDEFSLYRTIPTATQIELDPVAYTAFKVNVPDNSRYREIYFDSIVGTIRNYAMRLL